MLKNTVSTQHKNRRFYLSFCWRQILFRSQYPTDEDNIIGGLIYIFTTWTDDNSEVNTLILGKLLKNEEPWGNNWNILRNTVIYFNLFISPPKNIPGNNHLTESLPDELGLLKKLTSLDSSVGFFKGIVPTTVVMLKN